MAEVILSIGDRQHRIACAAGSEDQVRRMGAMIDRRWTAANRASGGNNAERSMLFVALMLADALDEAQSGQAPTNSNPAASPPAAAATDDAQLARTADRLEALARTLEQVPPNA